MSIFGDVWGGITGTIGSIGRAVLPSIGQGIAAGIAGGIQERIAPGRVPPTGGGPVGVGIPYGITPYAPISAGRAPVMTTAQYGPSQPAFPVTPASFLPVPQPGSGWLGTDPDVPSFFQPTRTSVAPIRLLTAINPISGKMAFWEHAGQPVLFSRDLRVCKRVARIAARASRGRPRRRARKR